MKRWLIRASLVLALAAVFHILTIMFYPSGLLMALSLKQRKSGFRANTVYHAPRVTSASREVVRPSPDLLYSICAYDVSEAPLRIAAPVPDTYWSLSFFASNTDNFFVINDRQAQSKAVEVVLVGPGRPVPKATAGMVVTSPTRRGVALFRTLVTDESRVSDLVRIQRQAVCESMKGAKD
jgi:uncharacterized membrane protein